MDGSNVAILVVCAIIVAVIIYAILGGSQSMVATPGTNSLAGSWFGGPWSKPPGHSLSSHRYAMTIWWCPIKDAPTWATYTFGLQPGTIAALCSTTVRLARDGPPEIALFVGTGREHPNMMLCARTFDGGSVAGSRLVDFIKWTGLDVLPDPYCPVYSAIAIDPLETGIDDMIIGRADGVWYLRARRTSLLGFGSSRTTYEGTRIATPGTQGLIPIAITISRCIPPRTDVQYGAKQVELRGAAISRIWSSFFIAPGAIRMASVEGRNYQLPTNKALSSEVAITNVSRNTSTYHAVAGRFTSTPSSTRDAAIPTRCSIKVYSLQPHTAPMAALATTGAPLPDREVPEVDAPSFNSHDGATTAFNELTPKLMPRSGGYDDTTDSRHVSARDGATPQTASDDAARPAEAFNHLQSRQILAAKYRQRDNAIKHSLGRRFQPALISLTGVNPLDPGTLNEVDVRTQLLGAFNGGLKQGLWGPEPAKPARFSPPCFVRSSDNEAVVVQNDTDTTMFGGRTGDITAIVVDPATQIIVSDGGAKYDVSSLRLGAASGATELLMS
jgi:hypothetical protein